MNHGYAKISNATGEDERIGVLAETNPLGLALFLLSIAKAYPYGVLPGSPRAYRAAVIPSAALSEEQVSAALEAQEEVGLIEQYEREGKRGVYIKRYHRYQDVQWFKVRASDIPLPESWTVPASLQAAIDDGALSRAHRELTTFGVSGVQRPVSGTDHQVIPCSPSDTPMIPNTGGSEGELNSNSNSNSSSNSSTEGGAPPAPDSELDISSSCLIESARAILGKLQPNGLARN